jgi:hypothetical protein
MYHLLVEIDFQEARCNAKSLFGTADVCGRELYGGTATRV